MVFFVAIFVVVLTVFLMYESCTLYLPSCSTVFLMYELCIYLVIILFLWCMHCVCTLLKYCLSDESCIYLVVVLYFWCLNCVFSIYLVVVLSLWCTNVYLPCCSTVSLHVWAGCLADNGFPCGLGHITSSADQGYCAEKLGSSCHLSGQSIPRHIQRLPCSAEGVCRLCS